MKTIRRSVIFSNTCKTHVWKVLKAYVYIWCPSCDFCFEFKKEKAHLYFSILLHPRYYHMENVQASFGKDWLFPTELKSRYIWYLYQLMLDLKHGDIADTPYINAQISDSSDS